MNIVNKEGQIAEEMEHLRRKLEEEKRQLEQKIVDEGKEYASQIASMEAMKGETLRKLTEHKDAEAQVRPMFGC